MADDGWKCFANILFKSSIPDTLDRASTPRRAAMLQRLGCSASGRLGVLPNEAHTSGRVVYHPTPMRDVPAPRQVCCAGGHSLALTASGDVLSWGSAKRGLLGQTSAPETALEADPDDESEVFRTSPRRVDALEGRTIVSIACAESHNLALDADGRVWAWGSAEHGRLGIAETDALPSDPYDTTTLHKIQPVPTVVCGLQGKRVTQLACADFHSLCLTEQGDVWAWGSARYGLLAMEDVSGLRTFPDDEHEVFQPTPIFLEGLRGTRIVQVSCAKQHNVVVDQSGGVWAWGSARYGRVGIENIGELPTDPDDEQEVFTPEPTLLHALRGEVIVQVACAAYHSLALSADGEVWAWGSARYGLLGLDDVDALPADPDDEQEVFQPTPTRVDGLCGKRVVQVVCSEQNSMAVCADGDVWSWGAADCGLLGTDDVDSLASEEALRTSILVGPIYFSAAPLQLPGVHDAVQVALANKHALVLCALDRDEATGAAGVCAALGKLLDDGTGADVHFTVGDSSRTFRAHRLILCARSEYFSRMFGETATASGLAEAALQQVRVEECTEFAFEAMLRWIYTGRVDLHDETLADVVDVADRYQLLELRQACARYMRDQLTLQNSMLFWECACRCKDEMLQARCFRVIVDNFDAVRGTEEFRSAIRRSDAFYDAVMQSVTVKRPAASPLKSRRRRQRSQEAGSSRLAELNDMSDDSE